MRGKVFWSIIGVVIVGLVIYFVVGGGMTDTGDSDPVDTEMEFENKVVYTTDMSVDTEPLRADCDLRGGEFNECGTPCEPDAEICTQECAYTCDDIIPEEGVLNGDNSSTSTATSTEEVSTSSATSTN